MDSNGTTADLLRLRRMSVHIVLLLVSGLYIGVRTEDDPCQSHRNFPKTFLGSRNQKCSAQPNALCDYYLPDDWYKIEDGQLLTTCPNGQCGVSQPAWMNGTLPSEEDGVVSRSVCVKHGSDCCNETLTIKVKKCTGFHVFYLLPFDSCPTGYCFESIVPCGQPKPEPIKPVVDPCDNPSVFPSRNFGSRNGHCELQSSPVCDFYLPEKWYRVEGEMLTSCPSGTCGVEYPVWLNGSLPGVSDGTVMRSGCVKDGDNCCKRTVNVKIQACSSRYVYNLLPLEGCPYAYCFESNQPCTAPKKNPPTDRTHEEEPGACEGSTCLLIVITVTTTLVLVVVIVLSVVVVWKKCMKKTRCDCAPVVEFETQNAPAATKKPGGSTTITSQVIKAPGYANVPAISPPPPY